jgi:hypothetical protein
MNLHKHIPDNSQFEFDASMKRSFQNWANKQSSPQGIRRQTIRKAAALEMRKKWPDLWVTRLRVRLLGQINQFNYDEVAWSFVRMMGQSLEADAMHLRSVS